MVSQEQEIDTALVGRGEDLGNRRASVEGVCGVQMDHAGIVGQGKGELICASEGKHVPHAVFATGRGRISGAFRQKVLPACTIRA